MKPFTNDPFYNEVLIEAREEANKAAEEWMNEKLKSADETHLLGDCGLAIIKITDKRKSFPKYYIKREWVLNNNNIPEQIYIPHVHSGRLEVGVKNVAMRAAMNVFKKYSVDSGLELKVFID